jgi:hypothetical protein
MSKIIERFQFIPVMLPVDSNDAAVTGDYICLKGAKRVGVLVQMGIGTASSDLDIALYQATTVAGGSAKVLNCLQTGRIYRLAAATDLATLQALTAITKVTQATADELYEPADSGELGGWMYVEVEPQDLDVDGGFDCIRADLTDPGAAKIVAACYVIELADPIAPELQTLAW